MISEAQKNAIAKYKKEHLKRVPICFQKEYYYKILKPLADNAGETVSGYIKKAIELRREIENGRLERTEE